MNAHARLLTFETRVAILATVAFAVLAVSLVLVFFTDRPEGWRVVKISTGVAALCAAILVVVNIILHG